jgi:Flp pilus assembly protein TadD
MSGGRSHPPFTLHSHPIHEDSDGIMGASRHKFAIVAVLLFVVAAWWATVFVELGDSVLTRVLRLDEAFYMERANEIASGQAYPEHGFYRSPLYPYLVAITGSACAMDANGVLLESTPWGIRVAQALMWCGIVFLLWRAGRRHLGPRKAWLPVILFVLYRPTSVFVNSVLVEIPFVFCIVLLLELLDAPERVRQRTASAAVAGVLIGLSSLLRGHALVLLLPAAAAIGLAVRQQRTLRCFVLLGTTALVLAPAAIHNSRNAGQLAGSGLNGGINLLIGNGPQANGFFYTLPGHDFVNDVSGEKLLSRQLGRPIKSASEADRIWRGRAVDAVINDPVRAARLWGKKVWLHLVNPEISSITPLELWPTESRLMRLLIMPYGMLSSLGIAGLIWMGWRDHRWRWWAIVLVLLIAVQSVFFVTTRYRLVLVPIFALLGSAFVFELVSARGRQLATAIGLVTACALFATPWGLTRPISNLRTAGLAHVGVSLTSLGQHRSEVGDLPGASTAWRQAERMLRVRLEHDPGDLEVYQNLARAQHLQNHGAGAERTLRDGIEAVSDPDRLSVDLIRLLHSQGHATEALTELDLYLEQHADDADMWHLYVFLLSQDGQPAKAATAAQLMLDAVPSDVRSWTDLGVALARLGQLEHARQVLRTGRKRFPDNEVLAQNLKRVEETLNQGTEEGQ